MYFNWIKASFCIPVFYNKYGIISTFLGKRRTPYHGVHINEFFGGGVEASDNNDPKVAGIRELWEEMVLSRFEIPLDRFQQNIGQEYYKVLGEKITYAQRRTRGGTHVEYLFVQVILIQPWLAEKIARNANLHGLSDEMSSIIQVEAREILNHPHRMFPTQKMKFLSLLLRILNKFLWKP